MNMENRWVLIAPGFSIEKKNMEKVRKEHNSPPLTSRSTV
jgi:hypothetical protein